MADPFARLGLDPSATVEDVLAARRRLAKQLHPDVGGDAERMREVNVAVQQALAVLAAPPAASSPPTASTTPTPSTPSTTGRRGAGGQTRGGWRVAHDAPSFTVEALPAEAFEAIVIVTSWMGDVLVDDPPYLLEAHLYDPFDCWCRIELVPDAGASSVSLVVAVEADRPVDVLPDVDAVRDELVANLNRLDWSDPEAWSPGPPGGPTPPPP